jgi:hypothetical protein
MDYMTKEQERECCEKCFENIQHDGVEFGCNNDNCECHSTPMGEKEVIPNTGLTLNNLTEAAHKANEMQAEVVAKSKTIEAAVEEFLQKNAVMLERYTAAYDNAEAGRMIEEVANSLRSLLLKERGVKENITRLKNKAYDEGREATLVEVREKIERLLSRKKPLEHETDEAFLQALGGNAALLLLLSAISQLRGDKQK